MASDTIAKMAGNRSMAEKMSNVVSQLDDEGKAQLEDLVADFERSRRALGRDKPKGETTPEYQERNPWHGQEKKNNFSLGETFPRTGQDPEKDPKKVSKQLRTVTLDVKQSASSTADSLRLPNLTSLPR